MTTTSVSSDSYLDLLTYGLGDEELASLAALVPTWQAAVAQVLAEESADPAIAEFATVAGGLVASLGEVGWQQSWLQAWHALHGRGFSLSETQAFFFRLVESCEHRLFAGSAPISRVSFDLFALLRRAVLAAISAAIEFEEETRSSEAGIPGELAALHFLRQQFALGEPAAVLSLVLANRNHFGHLAVSDLQTLPSLLFERLRQLLRPQDLIFAGREGEWLLVLPEIHSMAQPTLAAAHIQRVFANPFSLLSGRSMPLEATLGAAMLPEHGADAESILHAARLARWELLPAREGFNWFLPVMREAWQRRFAMAEELRQALHYETLNCFIQPQVDASSGECTGGELLLRWQRENGEWVPPQLAIEMIEENGWRHLFTDWLIRFSLHAATELSALGIEISLSINLTAADLLDRDLPEMFAQRLETWQVPGSRFTIELTESAMLDDPVRCLDSMRQLRALGFRLALDDFGTGYSSLSYLVNLPVDEIKIDRSFVIAMSTSEEHLRIVRTIIDLAWDLEMLPLAEGVEEAAQVAQLRQLGCNRMQGFLYAKPLPLDEFVAWYQARLS
ncbi:MAG: diguanylate cyclase/phosphodiesterase [Proteobacteria bacterium]|nr:diguanylate cyclase/phosphodiesterase [Pseudomonadota bacterium]